MYKCSRCTLPVRTVFTSSSMGDTRKEDIFKMMEEEVKCMNKLTKFINTKASEAKIYDMDKRCHDLEKMIKRACRLAGLSYEDCANEFGEKYKPSFENVNYNDYDDGGDFPAARRHG